MPELSFEFEVYCSCGEGLCNQTWDSSKSHRPSITIEPCEKCKNKAYDDGYDKGYDQGFTDAEAE